MFGLSDVIDEVYEENKKLKAKLKKAIELLEDSINEYQVHHSDCPVYWEPKSQDCKCGALRWANERQKFVEDNK